jgi:hypothetical protein
MISNSITFQTNSVTEFLPHGLILYKLKKTIMGTLNNNSGSQQRHDGQKDYQNSNERNRDHARSDTRDHEYKEYDETLTNDANFKDGQPIKGEMDFDDTQDNVSEGNHPQ